MPTKCFRLLALLPLLAGCGAYLAHDARTAILGMNAPDLIACAGIPTKVVKLTDRELLLQYDYSPPSSPLFSLKVLSDVDLAIGAKGACQAHFRVLREGVVSGVSYAGTSFSMNGPYSDCAPLIRECVNHPDSVALPAGYDAFAVMLPDKSKP